MVPRSAVPVRVSLEGDVPAQHAALLVAQDERPFALVGRWAGAAAVVGGNPLHVLGPGTDPFSALDRQPVIADAPADFIGGGWFGFLGYGAARRLEALDPAPPAAERLPEAVLAFHDHLLRLAADGRWWFEALWTDARSEVLTRRLEVLRARLRRGVGTLPPRPVSRWRPTPARAGHVLVVAACRERIAAGDLFQANISMRLRARLSERPVELFTRGTTALEPERAAFLAGPWGALSSFSPELFVERHGDRVRTAPIKGTRPRPADARAAEDQRAALESSPKDRAENVMIVDLVRNDLGRVCAYGSVRVETLAEVRPHVGVWHRVSEVSGRRRPGVDDAALVSALFPPGSVTGAPKIAAMNVIASLESHARQAFCGAIGLASPVAGLELSVAIRTVEHRDGVAWLDVGGGVVADSDPLAESDECLEKARPLLRAIGGVLDLGVQESLPGNAAAAPALPRLGPRPTPRPDPGAGLLETVLVQGGLPVSLDGHLERLAASYAELYAQELPQRLRAAVIGKAAELDGSGALRLAINPHGGYTIESRTRPRSQSAVVLESVTVPGGIGAHKWRDRRLLEALESAVAPAAPLLVDVDGTVLETSRGSVFVLIGGAFVTPPLDGRILAGTARARVLRQAEALGLPTEERSLSLAELSCGRGTAFVLNALRGAVPVAAVGKVQLSAPDTEELALMRGLAAGPPAEVPSSAAGVHTFHN